VNQAKTRTTTLEGEWNHLELGSGLGRECDGMMWYVMRIGDYDRLRYREWVRPGTATSAPLQDVFALEHTKKDCMKKTV